MADKTYKLAVFEQGSGELVVLLHGQVSTHNYMQLVADQLSKNHKVVSLDLLGFGDSPRPKDCEYTPDDHVKAIADTLDLKQPAIFVGHSMGALIAVRLAKTHPQLVKSLVLSALPVLTPGKEYKTLSQEFPGTRLLLHGTQAKLIHKWYEKNEPRAQKLAVKFSRRHYSHLAEQVRADTVRHGWEAYDRSMKQIFRYKAMDDLNSLTIPVTIVFGAEDAISNDIVSKDPHLSNIKLQSIPGAHHNTPLEHPEIVAKAI